MTGEFFDLEKLSKSCAEAGRYTFFFTSWSLNVSVLSFPASSTPLLCSLDGVADPPSAAVGLVAAACAFAANLF